jgi:UPF0176 protein
MPQTHTPLRHSAFYRFVPVADPAALLLQLRQCSHGLLGSIVVATEGINGTVAGLAGEVAEFETALQKLPGMAGLAFKHSACISAPFGRLKIAVKPEIVALGLPAAGLPLPAEEDAGLLAPAAWRALLAQPGVVVLDNRNHFEFRLGHFRNAVDPQVHNFRDFMGYVEQQAPQWRAAGQAVAMYCTGGIRCEKTAPWLRSLGLQVRQLQGGVLNYFQQLPDADRDWQGECFVFDNRMALDTRLQETPTTAAQVFDSRIKDEAWRLARAGRLASITPPAGADHGQT